MFQDRQVALEKLRARRFASPGSVVAGSRWNCCPAGGGSTGVMGVTKGGDVSHGRFWTVLA